jgi:hypothetical protein
MARSASSPLQPMSIGNMVSAAFQLYRSRLKAYLGITGRATLWLLPPFLAVAAIVGLSVLLLAEQNSWVGLIVLLIPVTIGLFIYCGAKAQMNMAIISWLAYGDLTQQPATAQAGRRLLAPRFWRFFFAQVLVNLLLFMVNFGLSTVQNVLLYVFASFGDSVVVSLLLLILYLASLLVYSWFYARWSLPELPIAVEDAKISDSITRSWNLTKGNATRVLMTLFVAFLVTLPLYILSFFPLFSALVASAPALATEEPSAFITIAIAFGISMLLLLLLNIFIVPFWQALKGVIYYDLRSRREGIDLQLRDRDQSTGNDLV